MIKDKTIVLAGINLYEGGPLSVFKDFLEAMHSLGLLQDNNVVLFVHNKDLFKEYSRETKVIELPKSRKSYLYRLYYEYIYFNDFSKRQKVDYWISLHDITPNVIAKHQYTYCHQPTPFYSPGKNDWRFSTKICLFSLFYKYLYGINIYKNEGVIVQQKWIREEFRKKYRINNIIVAKPDINMTLEKAMINNSKTNTTEHPYTFIYAAFPRSFKNFELICEACKFLGDRYSYRVLLTIDGTENAYSKYIRECYASIKHIEWIGIKSRQEVFKIYSESDCMIFPSKLETWGLPISEYKQTGKPIIMADLPYAHETIGDYKMTDFFNPDKAVALAGCMKNAIQGGDFKSHSSVPVTEPYAENWLELCKLIFRESD